jgi:hypothetical protein
MVINPAKPADRRRAASVVAEAFGHDAPFPPAHVLDALVRWQDRQQYVERLQEELKHAKETRRSKGHIEEIEADIVYAVKHMNALKVPKGYVSWDHIAAFYKVEKGK